MGSDNLLLPNKIATTVATSGKSVNAVETFDSRNMTEDVHTRSTKSCDSYITRTPLKRNCELSPVTLALAILRGRGAESADESTGKYPVDPFKRLASTRKHQVNWAPVVAEYIGKKESLSVKTISLPETLPFVSPCSSSLSSLSPRDCSDKDIGQALFSQRQVKEKIDLYEKISHIKSQGPFKRHSPGDFDHNSIPTMKLRATYLNDPDKRGDLEDSYHVFPDVTLSPRHNLPMPKGSQKFRKVCYRIRFAIPDDKQDSPKEKSNSNRGGGIRGICGYNRSNNWVSLPESETMDNRTKIDRWDGNSETSHDGNCDLYRPPDVWITPFKSKDGSQKWIAKRVWDIEDRDDEEPEYEVDHRCLMHGVKGLMGIPEERGLTAEEWQVNIDERDPWELTATKDATPTLPRRTRDESRPRLLIKKIFDVGGHAEDLGSVTLGEETFFNKLVRVVDFPHLEKAGGGDSAEKMDEQTQESVLSDSDSDASFISYVDYLDFDGSDTSSVSASLATYGTDGDSLKVEDTQQIRLSKHNERGFGRPNDWVKPNDAYEESSDDLKVSRHSQRGYGRPNDWLRKKGANEWARRSESDENLSFSSESSKSMSVDFSDSSESTKSSCHNLRGFGRPDEWVRSQNAHDESLGHFSKGKRGSIGFGRPDQWNDSFGASTECRSCRSLLTSQTRKDKSSRESPTKTEMTLNDWLEVNSEQTKSSERNRKGKIAKLPRDTRSSSEPKSHTYSLRYELGDEYKRGTPTWEKRALQQREKESNIKLWWEC